jgi:nucleoid-associated protein YgaU
MGNFEKLVVVVVLFLSAVVLAVSLRGGNEGDDPKNPLEAVGVTPAAGGAAPGQPGAKPANGAVEAGPQPSFLLDAGASQPSAPTATPAPAVTGTSSPAPAVAMTAGGSQSILVSTQGLTPSALDDFMLYKPVQGDTWPALAQRFYGDPGYVANLRAANDGMGDTLDPVQEILVPVYDFQVGTTGAAPAGADLAGATPADSGAIVRSSGTPPAVNASGAVQTYEVKDGDNLSRISKLVYGTTTGWEAIYEANRDQLSSPDKLKVGMKLKIPAAPAGATLAASKPAVTSKAPRTAAATPKAKPADKKKKVQ